MLERFRHWSPRYVFNRLMLSGYERLNPDMPWLTRSMIGILASRLKPTDLGLEWGSGRSTVWLAQRVAHLTSVESDPQWIVRVRAMIDKTDSSTRVTLHQADIGPGDVLDPANSAYVRLGKAIARGSLDFVLVDGALRDHCAAVAIDLLKPGGLLIIDNVERYVPQVKKSHSPVARGLGDGFGSGEWEQVYRRIENWECIWTSNGVTDTALWVKP